MLLVCSGDDTYRSLERAHELEAAFRSKYDPSGSSVDRLPSGKEGVGALLSALAAASLFAPRRFLRVDGLLTSVPKDRLAAVVQSLERDVEATIVVTVEEGELAEKVLKPFKSLPKFNQYDFPPLPPTQFQKWCADFAAKQSVKDARAVKLIADASQGDTWLFVNEFQKWKAGGEIAVASGKEPSVYDAIDQLLMSRLDSWTTLRRFDDANAVTATMVNQARSLVLAQSGCTTGIHPYVAQKLSRMKVADAPAVYAKLATAFAWSRTGQASAEEAVDVLG